MMCYGAHRDTNQDEASARAQASLQMSTTGGAAGSRSCRGGQSVSIS